MTLKEIPPHTIPTQPHTLNLHSLKRIHRDAPHETDVHTQSTVHAGARQADEDAEFWGCPLWGWGAAVAAAVVGGGFLDLEELGRWSAFFLSCCLGIRFIKIRKGEKGELETNYL